MGGQPAYKKVITDWIGDSEEAKKDEKNKATTVSYVGCNGKTKWVMSMSSRVSKAARFGVVLKRIVESITYTGAK